MIDELYHSLYKELTGWCTSMTGSRTLAEDLVQEAFSHVSGNGEIQIVRRQETPKAVTGGKQPSGQKEKRKEKCLRKCWKRKILY